MIVPFPSFLHGYINRINPSHRFSVGFPMSRAPCPGLGHQAALKLAQCILQARHSPLLDAQLRLLKEPPGTQSCAHRTELKEMGSCGKVP